MSMHATYLATATLISLMLSAFPVAIFIVVVTEIRQRRRMRLIDRIYSAASEDDRARAYAEYAKEFANAQDKKHA